MEKEEELIVVDSEDNIINGFVTVSGKILNNLSIVPSSPVLVYTEVSIHSIFFMNLGINSLEL